MNRADLIHTKMVNEAGARVAKNLLEAEAVQEWTENETRAVWNVPGGTATTSIKQRSLEVIDDQAFLAWVRERYPTEVVQVLRVLNTEWLGKLRGELAERVAHGDIDSPPGTKLDEGGRFHMLSITPDAGVRQALDAVIKAHLAAGRTDFTAAEVWDAAARLLEDTNAEIARSLQVDQGA